MEGQTAQGSAITTIESAVSFKGPYRGPHGADLEDLDRHVGGQAHFAVLYTLRIDERVGLAEEELVHLGEAV